LDGLSPFVFSLGEVDQKWGRHFDGVLSKFLGNESKDREAPQAALRRAFHGVFGEIS
jgi:hypothetical protein